MKYNKKYVNPELNKKNHIKSLKIFHTHKHIHITTHK